MNAWQSLTVTVLVQVTAILAAAAIALAFAWRRAALRHAIGVVALAFVLVSPALTLLLPNARWLAGGAATDAVPNDTGSKTGPKAVPSPQPARPSAAIVPQHDGAIDNDAATVITRSSSASDPPNSALTTANSSQWPDGWTAFAAVDRAVWLNRGFTLAAWIWAAGIVVLCLRFFSVRRQLHTLATSVRSGTIAAAVADEARRALGLKSLPPIGISDLAPMPLVLGCWRPMVVLPRRLVETAAPTRLRDVLIHEFAHILRCDPAINFAQHVARVVFWPHPGVHWLNRQIARSREEVCDNFVLNRANSTDYAQTLLELAEHCSGGRFALSLLGMFSRRWSLEARISEILNPARIKSTRVSLKTLAGIALVLAAISILVGGVRARAQDAKESRFAQAATPDADKPSGATKIITLRGVCDDQDAKPVPNLWVRVFRYKFDDEPPKLLGEVHAGDDGRFSIPGIEISAAAARAKGTAYLQVVVTARGYVSVAKTVDEAVATDELRLEMSNDPGTLSGVVTDENGQPVKGVVVFVPCCGTQHVPGAMSAVTDEKGRYAIGDLRRWKPEDTKTFDAKTGTGTIIASCRFSLQHPDYAVTSASYAGIPSEVNVVLRATAIIEGQVIDQVTDKPLANVLVRSQGVARHDSHQTRTDQAGKYRLRTNKDHFNIWAEADDRIAIAAKAVAAVPGKTVKDADIRMIRGGFVVGTVIDGTTGKPVAPAADKKIFVAHYGPARPRTGAAVTSTAVNPDGTYRLHIAPGKNYVYLMGGGTSEYVDVSDGGETKLNLRSGKHRDNPAIYDDPDFILAGELREAAREEDEAAAHRASGAPAVVKPPKRQRSDTPAGQLLDMLEQQNGGAARFKDNWLRTLKAIVDLGPNALPELIAELDSTSDNMMLRCCGFALRAIGDKRAVPALIRAIPRTLLPSGSDMGLRTNDADLAKWAQQHDLDQVLDGDKRYGFGRPVREIFGALNKLTGENMGEQELYHIFLDGVESQRQMKRELFYREAKLWAEWWEQHAAENTQDPAYARVNLPEPAADAVRAPAAGAHYTTGGGGSGWVLESIYNPKADQTFYDLDTGRVASLPKKWRDPKDLDPLLDDIVAWADGEGFDLMGTEYVARDGQRHYALRGVGLQAWELDAKRWKMESKDITVEALQAEGRPATEWLLHFNTTTDSIDAAATASFLYITQGTPGLLFVGIEVKDDSLKPGGVTRGDNELDPVAFNKGRRFGFTEFEEVK